jgi:chaperonin GroEL
MNNIIIGEDARDKIKAGVDKLANIVKVTYGAKGRNVVLARPMMLPYITKDGVTVAKEVMLEDPIENIGAYLIKQVASKTDDGASDGTTTATILAQAIVNEAHEKVKEGINPIYLKRGIDKATEEAVKNLKKLSTKANTNTVLKNIATISANGDKEIGNLIANIYKKTGKEGVIKVEEGQTTETTVDYTQGYEIDNGFLNWGFINNHDKFQVEYADCHVLLYEGYLETKEELTATIEALYDVEKNTMGSLLIISDNIDNQLLNKLLEYKERGQKITAIKSPAFGSKRNEMMKDIAATIGAEIYSKESGKNLNTVTLEGLGYVNKFVTDANKTILIGGKGEKETVENRIETIKNQLKTTVNKKEKDTIKERLAKMQGGVVVINVGGYSPVEIKEKIDRVEDALGATRASLEEGFVAGGGVTYLILSELLKDFKLENKDEQLGVEIIKNALHYPFNQILKNGGLEFEVHKEVILKLDYGMGINIDTEILVNLFDEGIIDPAKVTRIALENASSIASTFLTTDGIVWRDEEVMNSRSEM